MIMMDFEKGLNRAFRESFPQARVQGCNFHWKNCQLKKLRAEGLVELYNRDADFHLLTRYIWALSYIPEDRVIPFWEESIGQQAKKNLDNWQHVTDEVKRFLKYST
jgi:transposase-like protein